MFLEESKFLGVCSWMAFKFDLNVSGIRLLFLITLLIGVGSPTLVYFILYLIKPKKFK